MPKIYDDDERKEVAEQARTLLAKTADDDLALLGDFKSSFQQLSVPEQHFVNEYVIRGDAIGAYEKAFGTFQAGLRTSSVRVRAREFMGRPLIRAAIRERLDEIRRNSSITAERVQQEIAKLAFSSLEPFLRVNEVDGSIYYDFSEATPEQLATLSEVTVDEYTEGRGDDARDVKKVRIKQHSKLEALKELAAQLGMRAPERVEVRSKSVNVNINAEASVQEAADIYAASLRGDE